MCHGFVLCKHGRLRQAALVYHREIKTTLLLQEARMSACGVHSKWKGLDDPKFFASWLRSFDEAMVAEKRRVVLILDNCSAHNVEPQLSSVSLKFLPANTTAKSQPLDQGVIATVKALYKKRMCERVVLKLQREEPASRWT